MLLNHLKIAWRSLKSQPFFTFLNTFGLAIGIVGTLLISLYIYHELSYDKMFTNADRIYRIDAEVKFGGHEENLSEVSEPMAAALQEDFPQVELTTRFWDVGSLLIRQTGKEINAKGHGTFVDSTFFSMFGVGLLVGDPKTALKEPNTLILTKTAAEKHFEINSALGQTLILDNSDTYKVTGVIEDLPKNSFLRNHSVFMSMSGFEDPQQGEWGSHNYPTFIKLIPYANIDDFQTLLKSVLGTYVIPWVQPFYPGMTEKSFLEAGNYLDYHLMPLTDIHLYSKADIEMSPKGSIQNVYVLSFIALFLILLAIVNFINLSTARSLKRAKEVGVRKTLGSNKRDLIRQFLTESGLISFISLLLGIAISVMVLPFFNNLAGTEITIPYSSAYFWGAVLLATLLLGFLSGIYPAFFLSRFLPAKVLKGTGERAVGGGNLRNFLVVFQFSISVFLIVATLVVFQQLQFIQNKDLGYSKDQVLIVDDLNGAGNRTQYFKQEVLGLGQVAAASISSYLPTPSSRSSSTFFKEGATEPEHAINMQNWRVDFDYLETMDLELIAGRGFNPQFGTDSSAMILNETAVSVLGLTPEEALGIRISNDLGDEYIEYSTVIGVVKNFHFESLRENIGALSLSIGAAANKMAVKLSAEDLPTAIAEIGELWSEVAPGQPFNYYFMDQSFNDIYQMEQRLSRIFMAFTSLSIIIACLGLFGLAAFNAEKRTKEIGVRKVLGASVSQVAFRLTADFLKMVGIAIVIALPIGRFAMNKWLEDFSYQVEVGWWVYGLAALLAVSIAILTVCYQSIKAAIVNPVKSLQSE